jgi:hypothetical protein
MRKDTDRRGDRENDRLADEDPSSQGYECREKRERQGSI